jgi:hypothetical protein
MKRLIEGTMDNLKDRIKDLGYESPSASLRYYVPLNSLQRLMRRKIIQTALNGHVNSYQREQIVDHILRDGIKIFSALVLIDEISSILCFIEEDLLQDARLPFELSTLSDKLSLPFARDFFERQWDFSSPQLFRGTLTRSLDKRILLPFVKDNWIDEGGFGKIFEIKLHPDHQDLEPCFQQKASCSN